ncbi:MAG: hypothetical protein E6J26_01075 [Chloroflexi bacterium]|nr:MAG: hypothetical protein E6J26_01075 [Chloroflexota bacterium]
MKSYRNVPPLAGICSPQDALREGLSVDECVRRLKRYHYAFKRLHQTFTARIPAEPIYELKMAFSLHAHLCAEHVGTLRKRVGEMREPPLGLDVVPEPSLEIFFDEILSAPTTEELLLGLYARAIPALQAALQAHMAATNPVVDQPSVRVCRFALLELADMAAFGSQTITALGLNPPSAQQSEWLRLLDDALAAAGGLDGTKERPVATLTRHYSAKPLQFNFVPRRDQRFADPFNMGVNAEAFIYNPDYPPDAKVLMMFFKRLREIDVPEMMASIIVETKGKPWEYYRAMSRQLWDEARHALMGEVGFASLGVDWTKAQVNFSFSYALNTMLTPLERHGVLYFIEQGLMPKAGKRFEYELAQAARNPISMLCQDYDWADEVLHAHIGREWYVADFKNAAEAKNFGDQSWFKMFWNYTKWADEGLTQHRNWWPDVYLEYCRQTGIKPDEKVLAYHETYETTRADLKEVTGSA